LDQIIPALSEEAAKIPVSESTVLATDWMNGRRTPDANQLVKGTITGLNLGSSAPLIFRALVEATRKQMDMANTIGQSYTSTNIEKVNAQRRYGDAAKQYALLLKTGNSQNNDFYTYRYLASQGFLPGYNLLKLQLSEPAECILISSS
jgi:ribulose kinase